MRKCYHSLYLLAKRVAESATGNLRARRIGPEDVLLILCQAARPRWRPFQTTGGTVAKSYNYPAYTPWAQATSDGRRLRLRWGTSDAHHVSWAGAWSGYRDHWSIDTCKAKSLRELDPADPAESAQHYNPKKILPSPRLGIVLGHRRLAHLRRMSQIPCLLGDAYAVQVHGEGERAIWARYNSDGRRTGIAIRLPEFLRQRFGQWEHGDTLREALAEILRKQEVLSAEELAAKLTERQKRKARLLARLSTQITATYDDARKAGNCDSGIKAWAQARRLDPADAIPLSFLSHDSEPRARALAEKVASLRLAAKA